MMHLDAIMFDSFQQLHVGPCDCRTIGFSGDFGIGGLEAS